LQNLLVVLYARLEQVNLNAKLRKPPCSISKSLLELCSELFELCSSLLELLFIVPEVDACVVAESLELFLRDSVMLFLNLTGSLFNGPTESFEGVVPFSVGCYPSVIEFRSEFECPFRSSTFVSDADAIQLLTGDLFELFNEALL